MTFNLQLPAAMVEHRGKLCTDCKEFWMTRDWPGSLCPDCLSFRPTLPSGVPHPQDYVKV